MTKQEFQKRIGAEISQKDYSIVEHVYTWHPSISEVEGKEQIAELYKSFGMPKITSISMRYWTGTTLRWRRQRRLMKMEQDFFTRCSSTNWIITSTDTPENLRIRWIA